MNNLHISLTEFRNETRVLKQVQSLLNSKFIDTIDIAALYRDDLATVEKLTEGICIYRIPLKFQNLPRALIFQFFKYIEFCLRVIKIAKFNNTKIITIHSLALLPIGVLLKYLTKGDLVYDAHELETETFVLLGLENVYQS